MMRLAVSLVQGADGCWVAEVSALPGVSVHGRTRDEAVRAAQALALRTAAERIERGEELPEVLREAFESTPDNAIVRTYLTMTPEEHARFDEMAELDREGPRAGGDDEG